MAHYIGTLRGAATRVYNAAKSLAQRVMEPSSSVRLVPESGTLFSLAAGPADLPTGQPVLQPATRDTNPWEQLSNYAKAYAVLEIEGLVSYDPNAQEISGTNGSSPVLTEIFGDTAKCIDAAVEFTRVEGALAVDKPLPLPGRIRRALSQAHDDKRSTIAYAIAAQLAREGRY